MLWPYIGSSKKGWYMSILILIRKQLFRPYLHRKRTHVTILDQIVSMISESDTLKIPYTFSN